MENVTGWEIGEVVLNGEPLGDVVTRYLAAQPEDYQNTIIDGLAELHQNATPAYLLQAEAPLAVTIPVAGMQEADNVERALQQFLVQKDAPPHRILLYVNWLPGDEGRQEIQDTIQAIRTFQAEHPELPVSYATGELESYTIGGARKIVSDLALVGLELSTSTEDAMLLNHDIDLVRLHPYYLRRMWCQFTLPDTVSTTIFSEVRHARSADLMPDKPLPNMDTVNAWFDFLTIAYGGNYDLGNGISARAYMAAGGYDPTDMQAETLGLIRRIHEGKGSFHTGIRRAPGALLYTLPRRLYLQQYIYGPNPTVFWIPGDMVDASYRDLSMEVLEDSPIATRDEWIRFIVRGVTSNTATQATKRNPNMSPIDAIAYAKRLIHVAHVIIGGPSDTERVAASMPAILR